MTIRIHVLEYQKRDKPCSWRAVILASLLLTICLYFQGVKQVLVKLGDKGSALFVEGEEPLKQPIISAAKVLDTTGAGDTFTASFAVAFVEGKSKKECLRFAGECGCILFIYLFYLVYPPYKQNSS